MKMEERKSLLMFILVVIFSRTQLIRGQFSNYGCSNPLGMENGNIPDRNIVATTSSFGNNRQMFGAQRARLRSSSGYRADPLVVKQTSFHFIRVTLPKEMIITGIATQGLGAEWVTKYQLMAWQNQKDFIRFRDIDATILEKEFEGNTDGDNITFHTVPFPAKASEVLVVPTHWHENIALRFELYGCEPGIEQCGRALGMENGDIPDANIESFDSKNSEMFGPQRARLRSSSAYRADPSAVKQSSFHFIKVKLPKEMIITGIATQGLGEEWVTRYKMIALENQKRYVPFRDVVHSTNLEKNFKGNTNGVTITFNEVPFPVKTSEVLVVPTHWHKNIALRLELYGCEPGHFFRVSLEVLNTEFTLMYLDRENINTKMKEEEVLHEVNEYLKNVPGFLSVELYRFSLPFGEHIIGGKPDRLLGLIAEVTVHCPQTFTNAILMQLRASVASQRNRVIFGTTVFQAVTKKCEPPAVTMALSKDPRSATIKIVTKENRWKFFDVVASLDPECNPQQVMYSWEGARVDKELGMFVSPPYPLHKESTTRPELKLPPVLLQPYGLYYIRCLTSYHRMSTSKYDYGFFETVFMYPFRCEITPIQGKAILQRFTLNCSGGYDGKSPTSYSIKFNSSSGPVDITNWRSPSDAIRLPAGNLVDDYSVQLKVEANFPPLPPLHTHVAVKVTKLISSDMPNTTEAFENLLKEHTYNFSFLQTTADNWGLDSKSKKKIKSALMRGIINSKLGSLEQLKEEATCVAYCNSIEEETTREIQNMSLQFIEKALNFLNTQRTYVSNITETLLTIAALIVDKASESAKHSPVPKNETQEQDKENAKIITKNAVESIRRICKMRSQFLRNDLSKNTVRMEIRGISVTLAKINTSSVHKQLLRVKEDKVRLPAEMFAGKWKESLQDGSSQVIRFEKNPYSWTDGIITANLSVVDVTFWSNEGAKVNISNLNQPIRIVFSRQRQNNTEKSVPDGFFFLKRNEMHFHSVNIPSYKATVTVRIEPKINIKLRVYVKRGSKPTDKQYDLTLTLPNVTLPSCLNITEKEHHDCLLREPYEFVLPPNATGYIGRHFIGIKIQDDSLSTTEISAMNKTNSSNDGSVFKDGEVWGTEKQLCVKVKPPPLTFPRKFNSKTDVNYTFYATVGSCVFWDEVKETWSVRGCQVARESNETRANCLTNHLTAFSAQFYVVPNKIDLNQVFTGLQPDNMAVLCTVCLIFAFYAVGLMFARKADNRDKMKIINTRATYHEGEKTDGYSYEVSIQTGMWYRNGTTARVGIRLYGEEEISDTICFMDPWKKTKLFTRGSDNTFAINLPVNLGQLYKIQIWHDNSGKSPSWFLYQVVVTDNSTNEKWHFVANRWLAVEELDGTIDVEVKVASNSELRRFKSVFHWRAVTNFTDKHLLLSLFTRPPQNPFTRCQRLTCLLSIIMCSLITNAMFYRLEKGDNSNDLSNSFQLGPLEISLRQIVIGVQCGLICLPVGVVTVMIFRNIKKTIPSESLDTGEKRTQGVLPPCFVVIGWVICLSASISSGTFTIFYSIQWGAELSNRWLLSVSVSVLQDIVITGPIIIIINTSIASFFKTKQTVNTAINTVHKGNLVFHGNGEVNIQQPSEQELQRMRTMRLQQRKMYRFFVELALYITFVVLLMTVCYGNRKPSRYRLTKSLKDTFSGFDEVEDPKSFWKWFEEELVPGLYDARLYNEHTVADYKAGLIKSQIGFTVGLPRIRQIRVRPESTCGVFYAEPLLRNHVNRCISDVSNSNKDTTPQYKPGWTPVDSTDGHGAYRLYNFCPEPWRFTESMNKDELLLSYGDDGYIAKVGYDAYTALNVKRSLEKFDWIDERSSAVIVEFLVFEPAEMLLSDVMFVFERLTTGGRKKTIDVVPVCIFPSSGSAILLFYHVCILFWSIITLVLVVLEIVQVFKQGCVYFKRFFNWISLLQLFSSACAMLLVFLKKNDLTNFLQKIREDPFGFWSTSELVKWETIENVVLSITIVMTTIKCLKLIQINRHVHVMKLTLEAACRYLYSFFFIVLILALAFAQLGNMLFGTMDEEYSTLYYSLSSVFQMAIGIGKMRSKLGGGPTSQVFAPIFLMACMLSLTIIFTDTFIAVLDEAYRQANSEKHAGEDLGEYIKECMKEGLKRSVQKTKKSFLRPLRRKSSTAAIPKHEINPRKLDATKLAEAEPLLSYESILLEEKGVVEETNRAKLAETESLLSDGMLSNNDDVDIQSANRRASINTSLEKNTSEDAKDQTFNDTITKQSRYYFSPTKEDILLSDVKEAMEFTRSELETYLWKNDFDYTSSLSSFSSDNDSFGKWDDCSSLFGHYRGDSDSDSDNNQVSKLYVRCSPKNQGKLTLGVLRRYGHTYIESSQDSYV